MYIILLAIVVLIILNWKPIKASGHASRYKSYVQEEQKLAAKYGGTGYPTLHVSTHEHGKEVYEKYAKERDELQMKFQIGKYAN